MELENKSYYESESPQIMFEIDKGLPTIVFNVGTHGNEKKPIEAAEKFILSLQEDDILEGTLRVTMSNPPAVREDKRYLLSDLNRSYPGDIQGSGEGKIAAEMLELVKDADYVIDLHTAPNTDSVIILGSKDEKRLELAEVSTVGPIILFEAAQSCAMVDFVRCGIGIELGRHEDSSSVKQGIREINQYLKHFGIIDGEPLSTSHTYYEVLGKLSMEKYETMGSPNLCDFQPFAQEQPDIFPFLTHPGGLNGTICYLIRKVNRTYLTQHE